MKFLLVQENFDDEFSVQVRIATEVSKGLYLDKSETVNLTP